MEYRDAMRRIDEIQRGADYFKSVLELGDLAADLANELHAMKMRVAMLDEARNYWKQCCLHKERGTVMQYQPDFTASNSEEFGEAA